MPQGAEQDFFGGINLRGWKPEVGRAAGIRDMHIQVGLGAW